MIELSKKLSAFVIACAALAGVGWHFARCDSRAEAVDQQLSDQKAKEAEMVVEQRATNRRLEDILAAIEAQNTASNRRIERLENLEMNRTGGVR